MKKYTLDCNAQDFDKVVKAGFQRAYNRVYDKYLAARKTADLIAGCAFCLISVFNDEGQEVYNTEKPY